MEAMLNLLAATFRPIRALDTGGGTILVFVPKLAQIACSVQPRTGDEANRDGALRNSYTATMYCRVVDLQTQDRVVVNGVVWEVISILNTGGRDEFLTIELEQPQ